MALSNAERLELDGPVHAHSLLRNALGSIGRVALSLCIGLLLWQAVALSNLVPRGGLPPLGQMADASGEVISQGLWIQPLLNTVLGAMTGLAIAIALAIPAGLLLGSSSLLYNMVNPVIEFFRPIPPLAVLPVFILLFGVSNQMKTILVVIGCFFPILVQCISGVRDMHPLLLQTATVFRISRARVFAQIVLPAALPFAFTGIRVSASIALLVAVAVEVVTGAPGLGQAIQRSADADATSRMMVFVVMSGLLGVVIAELLASVQRRLITWVPRSGETG